jgi:nicotinamide mononucleotide (NMN) deamidase PncC
VIPTESWEDLVRLGARAGAAFSALGHTVAVAEGSSGGLISAALLATPGASAYYLGATVIYTPAAHRGFVAGAVEAPAGLRGATEAFAAYLAEAVAAKTGATWGLAEAGAAGPPNRYGDPAGHTWVAVAGPRRATRHLLTGSSERVANMMAFAGVALAVLIEALERQG